MKIKILQNMGISQESLAYIFHNILSDQSRLLVRNARKVEANSCHVTTALGFIGQFISHILKECQLSSLTRGIAASYFSTSGPKI